MSELANFTLFPSLTEELRLLIWSFAFVPRTIPLELAVYRGGGDLTAIPYHLILRRNAPPVERAAQEKRAHFVHPKLPSQEVFQVCREARHHALFLGYRTWKVRQRGGLVRLLLWHARDVVRFPARSQPGDMSNYVPYHAWLRLFALQYPAEALVIQNIALCTSLWHRGKMERPWSIESLLKFQDLKQLTMIIDLPRATVQVPQRSDVGWRPAHHIIETLQRVKDEENLDFTVPKARLVEDMDDIIDAPSLDVVLGHLVYGQRDEPDE